MKTNICKLIILSSLLITSILVKAQENSTFQKKAFSFEAAYTGDMISNMSGGLKTGTNYLGMANMMILFETENARLWRGGQFYINAANTHGGEPTNDLIGDFQCASNIEAGNHTYMHELWFKQQFKNISLTLGLQDLNAEFAVSQYGGLFINSSFGVHSTIANNVPSPIFPLTALGATIHWQATDRLVVRAGIFDGAPDDFAENPNNIRWKLSDKEGYLSIMEVEYNQTIAELEGSLKIGSYYHNHHADGEPSLITDNSGLYLVADQAFYQNNNGGKISAFVQLGFSSKAKNTHNRYLGGGVNYQGLFKKDHSDQLGVAVGCATFANTGFSGETAIEITYQIQITENISIQPDFQYIINPSGTEKTLNNASVGIIRASISF